MANNQKKKFIIEILIETSMNFLVGLLLIIDKIIK